MQIKGLKRKDASKFKGQRLKTKGEMFHDEFAEELLPSGERLGVRRDVLKTAPNNITTNDKSVLNNRKG